MAHNFYREAGGEDVSFQSEAKLLEAHGHTVMKYTRNNDAINEGQIFKKIALASRTIWASDSYAAVRSILAREKPTVVHFQNIFPLISPAVYYACKEAGVPAIQSLRNYRLLCSNAFFFRDNHPCEDCLGKRLPWPGIVHACYRNSRPQTGAVVAMLAYHNWRGTWQTQVDVYVALTEFARQKFIQGGLPPEKIIVKPNFVEDPGAATDSSKGKYVISIGRLSPEKGISTLINAWKTVAGIPLMIVGTGPLLAQTRAQGSNSPNIKLLGALSHSETLTLLKGARFLVFPTQWYETFGRVVIEAYASGLPVVASRIGAVAELVRDGETGLLFTPGNSDDLAAKVDWLWSHPAESARMGRAARSEYENKYTTERNYQMLIDIYSKALKGMDQ